MRQSGLFHNRLNLLWTVYYVCIVIMGVRLLQVQVLENVYYSRVAERNRTQIIYQTAPRGRIYDRNQELLATNRPTFSIIYLPGEKKNQSRVADLASDLAGELHVEKDDLLETLMEAEREDEVRVLAENLAPKTMFKLSEIKTIYPGVDLIVEARRYYPKGAFASHLLGYMGRMDNRSWSKLKGLGYRVDSRIGQSGVEKIFERELRGEDGQIRMEVDAQGRLKRILDKVPWKPGGNLYLTIDSKLQEVAEDALRNTTSKQGAVVVMDPRTGEILAIASAPAFDPNLFLLPEGDRAKAQIKEIPEFNFAIAGTYAPGSTFKIVVGAAMLNEGKVSPKERVYCSGQFWLGRRMFHCWDKEGHRYQDFLAGVTHSCDVYFYHMGLKTGADLIEKYEHMFRIGEKTGIVLSGEKAGNRFGPEARRLRNKSWYDGDTVNLSIGQGELLVTPIQMAVVISAVANNGTIFRPNFIKRVELPENRYTYEPKPEVLGRVELKPETWELIHTALLNVVKEGTGRGAYISELAIGGKTGTAQTPQGDDNAWFISYAGREGETPSLAVSVLVQHGGHGAAAAVPVARRIIQAAFAAPAPERPVAPGVPPAGAGLRPGGAVAVQ